jgi:hypothetical protein
MFIYVHQEYRDDCINSLLFISLSSYRHIGSYEGRDILYRSERKKEKKCLIIINEYQLAIDDV